MHIKHNTRTQPGLGLQDLMCGEVYISLSASREPQVHIGARDSGPSLGPGMKQAQYLVNLRTGCKVVPSDAVQFKHLPDATLDTGT